MILPYVLGYNCLMITVSEIGYHVKKITEPSIVILDLETTGLSKLLKSEKKTLEFEKKYYFTLLAFIFQFVEE